MTSVPEFRLDDLYNTEAVVSLPDGKEATVRTLTEAEISVRDLEAGKAANAAGAPYEDKESEEYLELIDSLRQLSREDHIKTVVDVYSARQRAAILRDPAFQMTPIPFPDNATEEEKEDVLRRRDESEARVRQMRSEELSRRVSARRAEVEELDEEKLFKEAEKAVVDAVRTSGRVEEFCVQTVYMSSIDEKGRPMFKLDAVRKHGKRDGLNESVYKLLYDTYVLVDIADPWVLQKHP